MRRTTMTTCRSDEDYWAELERMARLRDRLGRVGTVCALVAVEALVVFAVLYFVARSAMPMNRDAWHVILDAAERDSAARDE